MEQTIDWEQIGKDLRESAMDAHDGELPDLDIAYGFMADNPECFGFDEWSEPLPEHPPLTLVMAYFAVGVARA